MLSRYYIYSLKIFLGTIGLRKDWQYKLEIETISREGCWFRIGDAKTTKGQLE